MRLVLSGGGTGGHVIPNVALIQELRERHAAKKDLELLYIGTAQGMEKKLIEELSVPYKIIACGKLRRYFSWQNLIDFFKIPLGVIQAFFALRRFKPQVIFCKGGYVCFPVAIAGKLLKIPVILHESDVSPGLANRLCARLATTICVSYRESENFFRGDETQQNKKQIIFTGNPVRRELAFGNKEDGLKFTDFDGKRPVVFFMGGSSGAHFINNLVFENFEYLLRHYDVMHICGNGKVRDAKDLFQMLAPDKQKFLDHYRAFAYVGAELKDLYALADVIVSRAGALSLAEIDVFNKPVLLIPLPKYASRGDQIENALAYEKNHPARTLLQEDFTTEKFKKDLEFLLQIKVKKNLHQNKFAGLEKIVKILESYGAKI